MSTGSFFAKLRRTGTTWQSMVSADANWRAARPQLMPAAENPSSTALTLCAKDAALLFRNNDRVASTTARRLSENWEVRERRDVRAM
jgi:hypothetical protein